MVATRGNNKETGNENQESLPPRESRRIAKRRLKETVDEIFWDSDELNSCRRKHISLVKFEDEPVENYKSIKARDKSANENNEEDIDSEIDIFSSKIISQRREAMKEMLNDSNTNEGELSNLDVDRRRTLRQRHYHHNTSWLIGNKKLRGYPSMGNSSESEGRMTRELADSEGDNEAENFRSCRSLRERGGQKDNSKYSYFKHRCTFKEELTDEEGDLEEASKSPLVRRSRRNLSSEDETYDGQNLRRNPEKNLRRSKRNVRRKKKNYCSYAKSGDNEDEQDADDDYDYDDDENCQGKKLNLSQDTISASSDEKESTSRRIKQHSHNSKNMNEESAYTREKRVRRPVRKFMYEEDPDYDENADHCIKPPVPPSSSSDEHFDNKSQNIVETENKGARYAFRLNRRETRPFQMSFNNGLQPRHQDELTQPSFIGSPARKPAFNLRKRAPHISSQGSSSSSSDESNFEKRKAKSMARARSMCLPMNFGLGDMSQSVYRHRSRVGSSLADIDPMAIDRSITFDKIGGLDRHIQALKEMVIFPLVYPEVFEKFKISPPRGVIFYGPPGTGKTLVARALANECSIGGKKVAFFMRKGADCLSKWVGESERQLRLLFDQAYQLRPSIIFFDEIDGLAPVRSSRQDQIHSSIVSTLLALMDGLDCRGEIVVIGATNRLDTIDPALRRPGRFDREFMFPLPSLEAREQILKIHTEDWDPKPSNRILKFLAERTVGYCGADLKALCAESALLALKKKYPQIYHSKQKLLIDVNKIQVKVSNFRTCMSKLVPTGQRSCVNFSKRLNLIVKPLLQSHLDNILKTLAHSFPQAFVKSTGLSHYSQVYRPRLIIVGNPGQSQSTFLAPAVIHHLEKLPSHKLDMTVLYSVASRTPEEACTQVFNEARRNLPSILYIPHIDQLWETTSESLRATFMSLLSDMDPSMPLLLLATSNVPYDKLSDDIMSLFSLYREEIYTMKNPQKDERRMFFYPLFYKEIVRKPFASKKSKAVEDLPVVPFPDFGKLSEEELKKLEEMEEATLRELRIFLRDICSKLARNRMFYIFTKPVDIEEVPDYVEIIKNPMDLETMMTKIDQHHYQCARDFLDDIDLISANALEYNPDRNPEDKVIRHRACTLRDTAYACFKAEMDSDFEERCKEIKASRAKRNHQPDMTAPAFVHVGKPAEVPSSNSSKATKSSPGKSTPRRRKRARLWARGSLKAKKKKSDKDEEKENKEHSDNEEKECGGDISIDSTEKETIESLNKNTEESDIICSGTVSPENSVDSMQVTSVGDCMPKASSNSPKPSSLQDRHLRSQSTTSADLEDSLVSSSEPGTGEPNQEVHIDWNHLEAIFDSCIMITNEVTVDKLHYLHAALYSLIKKHRKNCNKSELLLEMEAELRRFSQFRSNA